MEFLGLAITILAGVLTYLAWKNGRWMKQSHQDTIEILKRMEEHQTEARKEMADAIRHLSLLIVSEGEKTRQAIK